MELHERAFHWVGGVPRVLVLDDLHEGVLAPDIYNPTLNPLYRDLLLHHGHLLKCGRRSWRTKTTGAG